MRTTISALSLAAALGLICCQSATAVPMNAAAIKQSAATTSSVEPTQYAERHTRHGIVKCYRSFVIGRYACHRY